MSQSCCHSLNSVFVLLGQHELCLRKDFRSKKAVVYTVKKSSLSNKLDIYLKKEFTRDTSLS